MDADIPAVPQSWDAHVWKNAPAPVRCVPSASLLQTCLRALCEHPETLERTLTRLPRELAQELLTELLAQRRRLTDRELRAFHDCSLAFLDLSFLPVGDVLLTEVCASHQASLLRLSLGGTAVLDLSALRDCTQLKSLSLRGCAAVDFAALASLSRLEVLNLHGCVFVNDSTVAHLASCVALRVLDLTLCKGVRNLEPLGALPLRTLSLGWTSVDDSAMAHVAAMPWLTSLQLERTRISDAGIETLSRMACLTSLSLAGCAVGTCGSSLARLRSLTSLSLAQTRFNDAGLGSLAAGPSLRRLDLSSTQVTDVGLRENAGALSSLLELSVESTSCRGSSLAAYRLLQSLNLADTETSDACMEQVGSLPLHTLSLAFCSITSAALRRWPLPVSLRSLSLQDARGVATMAELSHLCQLESLVLPDSTLDGSLTLVTCLRGSLHTLEVSSSSITDASFAHVAQLPLLRHLSLARSRLTDASIPLLCAALRQLQTLNLSGTDVTGAGLRMLAAEASAELLSVSLFRTTNVSAEDVQRAAELRPALRILHCVLPRV